MKLDWRLQMKRRLCLIGVVFMLLILVACDIGNNIEKIDIPADALEATYDIDTFDLSEIELYAYENENEFDRIALEETMLSETDLEKLSTPGTHEITVTYQRQSTTFTITMERLRTLQDIYEKGVNDGDIEDDYEAWLEHAGINWLDRYFTSNPDTEFSAFEVYKQVHPDYDDTKAAWVQELIHYTPEELDPYDIVLITDSGDIDDGRYNQAIWEGIAAYAFSNGVSYAYFRPEEMTDQAYLDAIERAVNHKASIIIVPSFFFEVAVYEAQTLYPEVKFIIVDGEPNDGQFNGQDVNVAENTISVYFKEEQAGFLAGYAAVMEQYTNLGFKGGIPTPDIMRYGIGFIAGAYYAAEEKGVTLNFPNDRYIYLYDFTENTTHKERAMSWYEADTEIIFTAAGQANLSVMEAAYEANTWVIGYDFDQSSDSHAVLTSAIKDVAHVIESLLVDYYDNDTFLGGEQLNLGVRDQAVGLPTDYPWLFHRFTTDQYENIYELIVEGNIEVPSTYNELLNFMQTHDLDELELEEHIIEP